MLTEFLSAEEIRDLTQRARRVAQARALQEAGIPFRQVASRIIVSRHHAREWLAGRIITPSHEPNLGAIL